MTTAEATLEREGERHWSAAKVASAATMAAWAALFWWLLLSGRSFLYLSDRTDWVVPMGAVIRGVMPFLIAQTVVLFLLVFLPQWVIAPLNWLRDRMTFGEMLLAMAGLR